MEALELNLEDPIIGDENNHELKASNGFNLTYRISSFENDAEFKKFIKSTELIIRRSLEYKTWHNYLTDVLNETNCIITMEHSECCSIQIHHHIPSLYMLTDAVVNKKLHDNAVFSSFDIASEVMEFHFSNYVGYVPLATTIHEKFTNGFFKIPIELVKGNYQYFLNNYLQYLDDEDQQVILQRLSIKLEDVKHAWTSGNYPAFSPTQDEDSEF